MSVIAAEESEKRAPERNKVFFVYVYLRDISKSVQPLIRHDCIAEIHLFTLRTTFNIERKSLSL